MPTYIRQDGNGGVMTATPETTGSSPNPQHNGQPTDMSAEQIRTNILILWDNNDGWIPGADYRRLAEAIGVPAERLKKVGNR